MLWSAIQFEI